MFVYIWSHLLFVYILEAPLLSILFILVVNLVDLFIKLGSLSDHTSTPVEVSVWQGGIPLTRGYGAFYDQVVWRGVEGVWAPHAMADMDLGVEGRQALAGQFLPRCRRQDACFWATGGI